MTDRLSPGEFGCPYCGVVDRTPACLKGDGSCADLPPDLPDPKEVEQMLAAEAETEEQPLDLPDDELLDAWAQLWHDLWIDGDLHIAEAIPEALARRGHNLQRQTERRHT